MVCNCGGASGTGSTGVANVAPVANAGPNQAVSTNAVVTLDGSASSDANGDPLTYAWTLTTKPAGSAATLSSSASVRPTFTADVAGTYNASLTVHDGKVSSGNNATVSIAASAPNVAPVANAGVAQTVNVGAPVTLDGSGSADANGDTLTYAWTLTTKPTGSAAALSSATKVRPTFTADVMGTYVASLVVNDGKVSSNAATVTITAALISAGVSVVLDYSLDVNGFFTPTRRALMDKAVTVFTSRMALSRWARVDVATLGGHYDMARVNPSTLVTSWNTDVVIPENTITVYLGASNFRTAPYAQMQGSEGDGATQLLSIRNVSGGVSGVLTSTAQYRPINASISFDLQGVQGFSAGITRQWHFDSDGNLGTDDRSLADPHYGDYTDFYTTAVHELGHVFGIYYPAAATWLLESDPGFLAAYSGKVQSDGAGGFVYTGAQARQAYFNHVGQAIPLDVSTKCHFATGVRSVSADGWTSLTYESNAPFRHGFSELEFAVLRDIGYVISPN
jgi:hypothetical protein